MRGGERQSRSVLVVVADGCGIGGAEDAAEYGTKGANTLGHVLDEHAPALPFLTDAGLLHLLGRGEGAPGATAARLRMESKGNDTPTGHWELMGLPTKDAPRTYPDGFPRSLLTRFEEAAGVGGTLGNTAENGVAIIERLGEAHLQTGEPIVYTSGDSVFQIAAHTDRVPLEELYRWCEAAREILTGEHTVGRVIARPFHGPAGRFERRSERRDWALTPPGRTALDVLQEAGVPVTAVGKIGDIFAHRSITYETHPGGNEACMLAVDELLHAGTGGLVFVNLVDFDSKYGHVRDSRGFAGALEQLDAWLQKVVAEHGERTTVLLSADHGNDPTFHETSDHTREQVPLLMWDQRGGRMLGERMMKDVGRTVCTLLGADADALPGTDLREARR